jgi:hypothetical protein
MVPFLVSDFGRSLELGPHGSGGASAHTLDAPLTPGADVPQSTGVCCFGVVLCITLSANPRIDEDCNGKPYAPHVVSPG